MNKIDTILFDLDNTLFDHFYSLKNGIASIQIAYPQYFANFEITFLIDTYNQSLEEVYQKYLNREITYEEKDEMKIFIFFRKLGLPEPTIEVVYSLRALYEESYQNDKRATPGSIETLVRLKERGYRLGILSNGQQLDQDVKAERIGIGNLVEKVLTSELLGAIKPDIEIFKKAANYFQKKPEEIIMVGDSITSDIVGAIQSGMRPILYQPLSKEKEISVNTIGVAVINKMGEILPILGIQEPVFSPQIIEKDDAVTVQGLGIDIVTAPRHCMNIKKEVVRSIMEDIEQLLTAISEGVPQAALLKVFNILRLVSQAAHLINDSKLTISSPFTKNQDVVRSSDFVFDIVEKKYSISGVLGMASIQVAHINKNWIPSREKIKEILQLVQDFFNHLSIDHPRAGLKKLRKIAYLIIDQSPSIDSKSVVIKGEKIEENN